jgi:hypothetical protein
MSDSLMDDPSIFEVDGSSDFEMAKPVSTMIALAMLAANTRAEGQGNEGTGRKEAYHRETQNNKGCCAQEACTIETEDVYHLDEVCTEEAQICRF